ncbi:MAG TPA: hypothetical protein DDW94_00830 [Deltaproteobacteria bacterium]|nr:MAG: hypothetical protein A2Z79_06195 [Deltaproteobacteria bacterium GWA2_55_82]OGQ63363.1 MAG: hypothetical protein A3I81_03185 [Deltaproteobacteria bacterium RIFCSPLOWO2_02_FULL_55_12]OIJ73225.1 MAG: hypothetical protein A2V21_302465 [Deltaproteobacteria bacterium GWC2_55_46]HBG45514.1 hypothetical protein [Deltaproteobacteria bacterium]HCY10345.1 hypothetical protein [Deltaproteobacteria bacterium]
MKRFMVLGSALAILTGFSALPAHAAYDTNVGCGLGYMLFKEIGQEKTLFQVFAVTTNGTFGNQTFGISSGTLECKQPASFVSNDRLKTFVAANMETLAQDMAAGSGETLVTLAELMEVPTEKRSAFYASVQSNFKSIYTSADVQSADVIDNIAKVAL